MRLIYFFTIERIKYCKILYTGNFDARVIMLKYNIQVGLLRISLNTKCESLHII